MKVTRRHFLGASTTAVIAAGTMAQGRVFGANDRIGVCHIGIHGQGGSHVKDVLGQMDAEVVALCDVDKNVLEGRANEAKEKSGNKPKTYTDMRDVFADDAIDAVTIATPNHWHSLAAIWACQAGQDVYVEKPLSHNVWEGRQLVKAAKKYGRIVQHGTQRRCDPGWLRSIRALHDGLIGDVYMARALLQEPRRDRLPETRGPARSPELGPVARAGAGARLLRQLCPLQLALVLALRVRRHRQSGRASDGRGLLGDEQGATRQGREQRRTLHL